VQHDQRSRTGPLIPASLLLPSSDPAFSLGLGPLPRPRLPQSSLHAQSHEKECSNTHTDLHTYQQTKVHLKWYRSKPALPGLKRCLRLAQANASHTPRPTKPNPPSPPGRSDSMKRRRTQTRCPFRTPRQETCASRQRRTGRLKACRRHPSPPHHRSRICWLLHSRFHPRKQTSCPGCEAKPQLSSMPSKTSCAMQESGPPTSPIATCPCQSSSASRMATRHFQLS
jgi:hypothetical protein